MVQAEASKGDWAIIADGAYLDFSHQQTTLNTVGAGSGAVVGIPRELATSTSSSLSGGLFGLAAAYTALRSQWGTVEPLGGLRYLNLSASANWTLSATFTQQGATLATQEACRRQRISGMELLVFAADYVSATLIDGMCRTTSTSGPALPDIPCKRRWRGLCGKLGRRAIDLSLLDVSTP
jgi:hypothetical protein